MILSVTVYRLALGSERRHYILPPHNAFLPIQILIVLLLIIAIA
jgi:hypothetical protein